MKIAVACFVKTPGLSPVKTRLAAGIGRNTADEVYRACVELMRRSMKEAARSSSPNLEIVPHWAVAEVAAKSNEIWSDLPVVLQVKSPVDDSRVGLGARMKRVFEELAGRYDGVMLIGADCPLLGPDELSRAALRVATSGKHILGPTDDGGFYLFGSRFVVDQPAANVSVWLGTPYSTAETAERFSQALSENRPVERLETLFDLDLKEDLERLIAPNEIEATSWMKHVVKLLTASAKL